MSLVSYLLNKGMKKILTLALVTIALSTQAQPITVSTSQYTVEELVRDVLIDSPCAEVSNITYSTGTGQDIGIGYFENTNPNFPMEKGIVLSSGRAMSAQGPKTGTQSNGNAAWVGDQQLLNYMQGLNIDPGLNQYFNATIIEFDFKPFTDEVSFNFLFASEEYGTYQCTFSDAFAFFLTNTETNVTTNLALVPGTTDPISVVTVRNNLYNANCVSVNPEYFGVYNSLNATTQAASAINFSGQTVKMTATAEVVMNTVYHIKLVVADRNDSVFDSAIFLEGGSFNIG